MTEKTFQFFKIPLKMDKELRNLKTKPASFWHKKGEQMVLKLFKHVCKTVPAYKNFLKDNQANGNDVKSLEDFKKLPIVTKDNYLRKYQYLDLFFKDAFFSATTYAATSGSTGESFFFPRGAEQDAEYEYMAELFLKNQFEIDKKTTLGVMGFALGIWIGGIFTFKNLNKISEKGYDFSLIPVGTDKEKFLMVIKKFGHLYDQIILMGYPLFIKDVLDSGPEHGVHWKHYNIRILTAAEGFSENFRMYIAKKAGLKSPLSDIINMYGTVELGTMAHETAFANLIRNVASKNKKVFEILFPKATNIPTLAQFYPHITWFEEVEGEVIASGYGSSIPFLRYRFNDLGGVITFDDMLSKLRQCGVDIFKEMKERGIKKEVYHLPFVYLYARSDFAVVFRGANIYPGEIRNALDRQILDGWVTGKFTMIRKEDEKMNQTLEMNVELKKGIRKNKKIVELIANEVVDELKDSNSEFKNEYLSAGKEKLTPSIVLWPYQHKLYFRPKGKQQWIKKVIKKSSN